MLTEDSSLVLLLKGWRPFSSSAPMSQGCTFTAGLGIWSTMYLMCSKTALTWFP